MSQYRNKKDKALEDSIDKSLEAQAELNKEAESNATEFYSDAFKEPAYVRHLYTELCREYNVKILPRYAHLTKAKAQLPPYWNDAENKEYELPMYQHNVASGRYGHSISQLALTYNSQFPNQSYSNSLVEVKILREGDLNPQIGSTASYSAETSMKNIQETDEQRYTDYACWIQQAFDNIIKLSSWAKREHLKMVSDLLNYSAGIFYFPDKESYKYKYVDIRKMKFPSGTSTDPSDWEYCFMEHETSLTKLIKKYERASKSDASGWQKAGLEAVLLGIINDTIHSTTVNDGSSESQVKRIEDVKDGLAQLDFSKVSPATIPLVTCFWKNKTDKVSVCTFIPPFTNFAAGDVFVFSKDNVYDNFSDAFSVFPADETESEIRMVRGWGEKIYSLCLAYDRAFCKFLDHINFSATLFLKINPNDLHKKILHFGTMNVGEIEDVKNFPSALKPIVESIIFLDSIIDRITFTKGLNKTEMTGEGRGGDLATILLTTEGRIQKHLMARFLERLTEHYKKVMRRLLLISSKKTALNNRYPEVDTKFLGFLKKRNVPEDLLKFDDTSNFNDGLPSDWLMAARKSDSSGLTNSLPHSLELLNPYLSSLPESGFKYILRRIISEAFGDEDLVNKVLPDATITKFNSEADLQLAEMQAHLLTANYSDFDTEIKMSEDINPEASDSNKFATFPPTKQNDHIIFLTVLLAKVDDAVQKYQQRSIGQPTLHIWLYNLVSTSQGHVEYLRQDAVRSKRSESLQLFKRFGEAFNLLRQVESQANATRAKKLDQLQTKLAQQDASDPKRIEAEAKLIQARAAAAKVSIEFSSKKFDNLVKTDENRRANEAHNMDLVVKGEQANKFRAEASSTRTQSLAGRPNKNKQ